ncbi:hypothetical protein CFK38_16930 [Brachybacterium vulturis]|uniref:AAA family ATPase n=1 Tax=Brachybacterium vulturis TaxID=2017484 RepID=A0A291GSR8_9MICO|nr:AAA domain-containing protein [Brachybacterium vulturis]ATG53014.1 hypothetical protein CFK38_16930 [Brachybacterium vulturis]
MAHASTSTRTSAVTDYFTQVLHREPLEEVTFSEASAFVATTREQLATGTLTKEHTQALFDVHDRAARRADSKKPQDASISVAISLASVPGLRGAAQRGLLLLGATLYRDGRLEPELETGTSPWIPAERLTSSSVTDLEVMAGPLRTFWTFVLSEIAAEASRCENLADAMTLAETLFERVSGSTLEGFTATHAGAVVEQEICYVQEHDRINAVGGLLAVYEALSRQSAPPPILERIIGGWDGPRTPESQLHDGDGLLLNARLACGSMSDKNPLTASQRRAVHAVLQSEFGEISAVSGPPGTGKTTMLQAIVAGMITRRALERGDAPVIVGTSTNNQAVTNIISSFASVTKETPGSLDRRWLPHKEGDSATEEPLRSLAVYCPSNAKLPAAKQRYLVEQKDRSELYADYSGEEYLAAARDHFLIEVHRCFGGIDEPARVQDWIHDALTEVDGYRVALLGTMSADGPSVDYLDLCGEAEASEHLRDLDAIAELRECTSLEELDETLDVTLRYAEFWLAVHYYEAEWLLADHLDEDERFKSTWDVLPRVWPQAAALTPCFVMTLYQVPKIFERCTKRGAPRAFDMGRIDLLIVDEAGQVDSPIGVPALALAQRALVVGDEKQLAPVWSLDEETDREIAEGAGIGAEEWTESLRERGVTCSAPSSLMRAASNASRWSFGDGEPGLLLREHFRCHPEIIGFSNELLYQGLLEPRRPAQDSLLDGTRAAFEWVDVQDSQDSRQGSSRINLPEATAIATWIVEHYASFYDLYHHRQSDPSKQVDADSLIGVVTPFSAQAGVIAAEIRKAARAADDTAGLPNDLAKLITVGTAHRLQGAERPIILFSAVYGTNSPRAGFIDANPELMNVAVSRAKDLLIVFAAPNRWDNGPIFSVMSRFAQRATTEAIVPEEATGTGELSPSEQRAGLIMPATPAAAAPSKEAPQPSAEEPAEATPARARQGPLTTVIREWKTAGVLFEDDADLAASAFNLRLADAGILDGEPGQWRPTKLAGLLGVVEVEKSRPGKNPYISIEYTPGAQKLLLQLYRDQQI